MYFTRLPGPFILPAAPAPDREREKGASSAERRRRAKKPRALVARSGARGGGDEPISIISEPTSTSAYIERLRRRGAGGGKGRAELGLRVISSVHTHMHGAAGAYSGRNNAEQPFSGHNA